MAKIGTHFEIPASFDEIMTAMENGRVVIGVHFQTYDERGITSDTDLCFAEIASINIEDRTFIVDLPKEILFLDVSRSHVPLDPESYPVTFSEPDNTVGIMKAEFFWRRHTSTTDKFDVTLTTNGSVITADTTTGEIFSLFEDGVPVFLHWPYNNALSLVNSTWIDDGTYHIHSNDVDLSSSSLNGFPACADY